MYIRLDKYGLIFWANASLSVNIFKIKKRNIRIMSGVGKFNSCRDLFKKLQILPLRSQYIFSLLLFTIKNKNYFTSNTGINIILIFMILIPIITIIYTYPLKIYQQYKKEFCFLEARSIITYLGMLNYYLKTLRISKLNKLSPWTSIL
jgi:hypothetical protein